MKRCTKTTLNTSWAVVEPSKTQWKEHGLKNSEQQEICLLRKDQRNSRSSFYFGTKNFSKANPELPEMRRRRVKPRRGMAPQHFTKLLSRCWRLRHCGLDSSLCFRPTLWEDCYCNAILQSSHTLFSGCSVTDLCCSPGWWHELRSLLVTCGIIVPEISFFLWISSLPLLWPGRSNVCGFL